MRYIEILNEFLQKFDLNLDNFEETENGISFLKIFNNKKEIDSYLNYDYTDIFNKFNNSFKILISNPSDSTEMQIIKYGYDKQDIKEFVEDITSSKIKLEIKIDKNKIKEMLISKNHNFDKDINIIVYFKIDTLSKQLIEIGLNKLEYIIKEQQYNLIIVLDKEIKMINDYIGILSDNFINEVNICKQKSLLDKSINKVAIRNNYCNWVGGTKYINPNYFYFDIRKNYNYIYDKKIVDLLMNKFIQLVFAFTFNYTNNEQEKYYSFVSGYKKLKIDYIYIQDISIQTCNYLKKIYEWIYSTDKIEEKIIIVRNIISMFLCDECSSSYYHLILNNSKEIYESIQINFEVYLEGNVKEYFNQIYRINEAMDKKVKNISSQIDRLSDNLNKNFLTTVGASIVTVLGYLSKPSRNLIVYIISGYIAYILLNSILISITTKSKFNNIIDNYENWISSFGRLLEVKLDNKKRLDNLNSKLKNTFNFYWGGYILFNIVIICAGVFCLINLNMLIKIITTIFK